MSLAASPHPVKSLTLKENITIVESKMNSVYKQVNQGIMIKPL